MRSLLWSPFVLAALATTASAQSLSRLLPNLVLGEVTIAAGPSDQGVPGIPHTAHFDPRSSRYGDLDPDTQTFLEQQVELVPELNRQINAQLATFPVGSSSGGFTYAFNPAIGTFTRSSESFGPLLTERALTVGKGQFSFGALFQHASYNRYEGLGLGEGALVFYVPHNDCCPGQTNVGVAGGDGSLLNPAFEGDVLENRVNIHLSTQTFAFFSNFGLTDALDLGIAVPVVRVKLDASVDRTIVRFSTESNPLIHSFDNGGENSTRSTASGTAMGIGDILLRAKYRLWTRPGAAVAAAGELRLPTGDETELLGSGAAQGKVFGILSLATLDGRFSPHVNVGYTFSHDVSDEAVQPFVASPASEFNYAVGFDALIHPRVTVAADIWGRQLHDVGRVVEAPATFRFTTLTNPTPQTQTREGFATETGDLHIPLGSFAFKINLGKTLLLNGGLIFPLTDNGLHNRITSTIGVDFTFGR
jgi:hypothetical protein